MVIFGEQIRAARSLLGWTQSDLAEKAGIAAMTVKRFEAIRGPLKGTIDSLIRVQSALEEAGIIFISADKEAGVGVRLANPRKP